jgi:hypothetical protein
LYRSRCKAYEKKREWHKDYGSPAHFFLSAAGVLFLLSEKGEFFMEKKVNAAGVPAAKPPIDMKVPSRIETATFALG